MRRNRFKKDKGMALILWSFILNGLVIAGIVSIIQTQQVNLKMSENILEDQQLTYLAERGIHYAFVELKMHGFNWFTHRVNPNGQFIHMPNSNPDKAKNPSITGADIDTNGFYRPLGNDQIKVRIYKTDDDSSIRWIMSKAELNGKTKVVRVSINADSLYNYFKFINGNWYPGNSNYTYDCQGFGKIYVNGDIIFDGPAKIKDPKLVSTNSEGVFKVRTVGKYEPFYLDVCDLYDYNNKQLDGYAFLTISTKTEPFPYPGGVYPSDKSSEWYGEYNDRLSPYGIFAQNYPDPYDTARFVFTNGTEDINDDITVAPPVRLKNENGSDANYSKFIYRDYSHEGVKDIWWNDSHQEEKPVKYIRIYYQDVHDKWHITANPKVNEALNSDEDPNNDVKIVDGKPQIFAQVFDGIDTAAGDASLGIPPTPEITIKYSWDESAETATLKVKEDINYTFSIDANHTETVTFNPEYERRFWGDANYWTGKVAPNNMPHDYYNDPRKYAQYGYYRGDDPADQHYGSVHWDDNKDVNFLNTSYSNQAEAFRNWLEGNYSLASNNIYNNSMNLYGKIRERNTGAKDMSMVEIENTFSSKAKEGGIWIGYEDDGDLTVYVKGTKVYDEGNPMFIQPPSWIAQESFITGVKSAGPNSLPTVYHADTITIDVAELANNINLINQTNGIIWVNYKEQPTSKDHDYHSSRALKIKNAETIPREGGITFVSPNPVFIQGDINYQKDKAEDEQDWQPTSIISDSEIYLLGKHANLPAYDDRNPYANAPAYADPYFYEGWQKAQMLRYLSEYAKNSGIEDYVKYADDIWPKASDSEEVKQEKLQVIDAAVKAYYDYYYDEQEDTYKERVDKEYCELSDDFDVVNDFPQQYPGYTTNPDSLINYVRDSFAKAHSPIDGPKKRSMPMIDDNDRDMHIYASLITPDGYPTGITVENIAWRLNNDGSQPANGLSITKKGMFPNVKGTTSKHWSDYWRGSSGGGFGSNHDLVGSINNGYQNYTTIAQDYSNNYPPGDLTLTSFETWYTTSDESFFNSHKTIN